MAYMLEAELMTEIDENFVRKRESFCKRHCLHVGLVTLTAFSFSMSIATLCLYFNTNTAGEENTHDELSSPPIYAANNRLGDEHNSTQSRLPAYAHKVLTMDFGNLVDANTDSTKPAKNRVLRIDSDHNDGAYEISLGVTLLPQGIKILYPGTYFVYKSIYFTPFSRMECENFHSEKFTSNLVLNSTLHSGTVTTLLQSFHTCCPTCRDSSETAFAGGVFYLEQGDVIQVEVTGEDWVDVERDVTYVGLMKLGSLQ